ncbi:MAG: LysR family transcriptional regulator, partial [Xanthobacteraceae bacterium]
MTLDQLRVFIEVAKRGHVTRAAEALGMSQSAAS